MPEKQPNAIKSFVNGGFGGVCTVLSGHPLDTIKVRLQTMPQPAAGEPPMYTGTFDCAMKIIKNEGFFGLYKGISAPLNSVAPIFAMCFAGYSLAKKVLQGDSDEKLSYTQLGLAGSFSGLFSTVVTAPGERVKCLLQVQQGKGGENKYNGFSDTVVKLYKEGGIRSVYKGAGATLVRDVPGNAVFFVVYEYLKDMFIAQSPTHDITFVGTLIAGGLAGMAFWISGMPADVLKSRIQTAPDGTYPHGIRSAFAELMKKEGLSALYKGVSPVMIRSFPANAAGFFGIEFANKMLTQYFPNF